MNPVRFLDGTIYPNVFCFECNRQGYFRPTTHHCDYGENLRAPEKCLIGLLDYKSARDTTKSHGDDRLPADSPCTCAEIFDPFQNYCRPLICPAGEVYKGCRCVSLLTKLTGLSVILKVKVTAKSDRVEQLTGAQLRKLNTALKKGLETTAIHTTVEIDSTFRQENTSPLTYLCVVEAQSHPGHDTKITMKPFLRYLDTDETLNINIGKLDFSASLTSKAMLWTEFDSEQTVYFFKTCCLDQDSSTLHRVYTSKGGITLRDVRYQFLSRLLYCNQLELNAKEYIMSDDMVTVNVTEPRVTISDYHSVSPTEIRICADAYIQKTKEKKQANGAFLRVSYAGLLVSSLASTIWLGAGGA